MSKVLLFDCDGVLADTERYGHLPAFNQMWRELGVNWQWNEDQYGVKLKIGGGKERMSSLIDDADFRAAYAVPDNPEAWTETIAQWHKRKTALYTELINSGRVPGRPGIRRLAQAAADAGWQMAVCSTSALDSVQAVLQHVMGAELTGRFAGVFAGDVVKRKKPAPDIYNLAAEKLGVTPAQCLVFEDSRNGLEAATAAGMKCIVTVNGYTRDEGFSEALIVVSDLGEPDSPPIEVLANRTNVPISGMVTLEHLEQLVR